MIAFPNLQKKKKQQDGSPNSPKRNKAIDFDELDNLQNSKGSQEQQNLQEASSSQNDSNDDKIEAPLIDPKELPLEKQKLIKLPLLSSPDNEPHTSKNIEIESYQKEKKITPLFLASKENPADFKNKKFDENEILEELS